jgi:hypothetical protein
MTSYCRTIIAGHPCSASNIMRHEVRIFYTKGRDKTGSPCESRANCCYNIDSSCPTARGVRLELPFSRWSAEFRSNWTRLHIARLCVDQAWGGGQRVNTDLVDHKQSFGQLAFKCRD